MSSKRWRFFHILQASIASKVFGLIRESFYIQNIIYSSLLIGFTGKALFTLYIPTRIENREENSALLYGKPYDSYLRNL